jgi:hypothetical protein
MIWSVSFSPDGTTLATGSSDKTVKLLDATAKYGPDGLLLAHPTFDIWSYGVVLYYAIAHKPLLETTGADQLRGKAERVKLARWSTADLTYAINDLDHGGFLRTLARVCGNECASLCVCARVYHRPTTPSPAPLPRHRPPQRCSCKATTTRPG